MPAILLENFPTPTQIHRCVSPLVVLPAENLLFQLSVVGSQSSAPPLPLLFCCCPRPCFSSCHSRRESAVHSPPAANHPATQGSASHDPILPIQQPTKITCRRLPRGHCCLSTFSSVRSAARPERRKAPEGNFLRRAAGSPACPSLTPSRRILPFAENRRGLVGLLRWRVASGALPASICVRAEWELYSFASLPQPDTVSGIRPPQCPPERGGQWLWRYSPEHRARNGRCGPAEDRSCVAA